MEEIKVSAGKLKATLKALAREGDVRRVALRYARGGRPTPGVAVEEVKVSAGKLKATLKALVREGNVRRIVIRNASGRTLLDMPLTAGLAGALLAPFWVAVAGVVALAKE